MNIIYCSMVSGHLSCLGKVEDSEIKFVKFLQKIEIL